MSLQCAEVRALAFLARWPTNPNLRKKMNMMKHTSTLALGHVPSIAPRGGVVEPAGSGPGSTKTSEVYTEC